MSADGGEVEATIYGAKEENNWFDT